MAEEAEKKKYTDTKREGDFPKVWQQIKEKLSQAGSTTDFPRRGLLLLLGWLPPEFLDPCHFKAISL